uniref:Chromosome partition protein Smc,Chromosome partition protein Smc n=1 Tax=Bacillus subtilis (strain 168) TaxID=224308 RepID=UPI000B4966D6|nr:Chain A, Chromosome partition protein Smc,Chromosome partition protein Smc [Bacillus subtilis subsp. subtilis str. 168]5NMO_B Chain B, Chromosome partition protein Smc,Chromosome partition protein Smc [Bacillus subtilis subsp. subtilis str. 168]
GSGMLNRVEDILHELEGQVEPLKIQASIAKDYLEKKKELEHVEIALTAYDIEELHGKWSTLKEKVQMAKESGGSGGSTLLKDEEVKLGRMEVELDNLLQYLREEYSLSFEGAKEKYQLETDPEEARKRVKLIKLAIEELGTVNLGSIDEFERVNERYKFLSEQKEDL